MRTIKDILLFILIALAAYSYGFSRGYDNALVAMEPEVVEQVMERGI